MNDYKQQIAIVKAIRLAIPDIQHYASVSKRIIPAIQSRLHAIKTFGLTDYVVYLDTQKLPSLVWGQENIRYYIRVWGNGLLSCDAVSLQWYSNQFPEWQHGLQYALDVADMSDYQERMVAEQELIPQLEKINQHVRDMIMSARALIENLPVPTSATVRNDPLLWGQASHILQDKFPLLFKAYIDE